MVPWKKATIGTVADLCLGKMLDQEKNRGEPLPYLANVNVRWGEFALDNLRTMRFEPHELDRYGLKLGDIVMCEGGEPGRCAIWKEQVPGMMIQKALHRIRPHDVLDYRFLFYDLLNIGNCRGFDQYFTGATIKHLPGEKLAKVEVNVPPLPIQRRIAGILSAYDELIENSQRRIKILEAMARALYREWFVHFRFPGHASVPRVPSSLGEIPKGWEVRKLGDLLNVDKGVSYNGAGLTEVGNPMVNLKNIQAGGGFRRDATKPYSGDFKQRHTVKPGDVVLANTDLTQAGNVVASPALIPRMGDENPILISHHLYAVRPVEDIPPLFVYHLMLTEDFRGFAKGFAIGTTVLGLPKEGILNYSFACAPPVLIRDFVTRVSGIHELMEALHERIDNLRRTRDLLLPRLLSGQIDVEAMPA
jgi:type I restriction enzyme S subunit